MKKLLIMLLFFTTQVVLLASERANDGCMRGHYAVQRIADVNPGQFIRLPDEQERKMQRFCEAIQTAQSIQGLWDESTEEEVLRKKTEMRHAVHTVVEENKTAGQLFLEELHGNYLDCDAKRKEYLKKIAKSIIGSATCYMGIRLLSTHIKNELLKNNQQKFAMTSAVIGGLITYMFSKGSFKEAAQAFKKFRTQAENLGVIGFWAGPDFESFAPPLEKNKYSRLRKIFGIPEPISTDKAGPLLNCIRELAIITEQISYEYRTEEVTPTIKRTRRGITIQGDNPQEKEFFLNCAFYVPKPKGRHDVRFIECNGELCALPDKEQIIRSGTLYDAYMTECKEVYSEDSLYNIIVSLAKQGKDALTRHKQIYKMSGPRISVQKFLRGLSWYDDHTYGSLHQKGVLDCKEENLPNNEGHLITIGSIKITYCGNGSISTDYQEIDKKDFMRSSETEEYMIIERPTKKRYFFRLKEVARARTECLDDID